MTENYCDTRIEDAPTFEGQTGAKAWRIVMPPIGQRTRPEFDATVDGFIIHAPGVHPLWDHWSVSVIHLREIEGTPSPTIRRPGVTHELMIAALDPCRPLPSVTVTPEWKLHWLLPFDLEHQFAAADDAMAAELLERVAQLIVAGTTSPDSDYRRRWTEDVIPAILFHLGQKRSRSN